MARFRLSARGRILAIALTVGIGAKAAEPSGGKLFVAEIQPALTARCLPCHNSQTKKGGLDLSSREALLRGGDSGAAVMPGAAKESELYRRIRHEAQPGMPYQTDRLPDELIAKFADWINGGAPYDATLAKIAAAPPPASKHWAFEIPRAAPIPQVKNLAWVLNPIDAFVAAEQEKRGLKPLPPADKRILLRRVYLDLIGLPPTMEETRAFLSDGSADAYEKVVDRLLADRRYGERWGRHWMDVWRYSDWYGRRDGDDQRNSARHIWHWRDWIIESLNSDKGYDHMILEMLAADEIAPTDTSALRATGYLARDFYRFNRNVWMQDTVEHTSAAFLGVTMKCARCHDHKYDPISQEEYYRLRAFFEPYDVRTDRISGQPDIMKDGLPRVFDGEPREGTSSAPFIPAIYAKTYRLIRGDDRNPDTSREMEPGVPAALGGVKIEIKPVSLPLEAYNPDLRPFVAHDLIEQAKTEIVKAEKGLAKAREQQALASKALVEPAPRAEPAGASIDFRKEIRPILEKNCFICHSAKASKSGLAVDTVEVLRQGGSKSGPAVIAGNSKESPLLQYLSGEKKPAMPFGGAPLAEAQIALIARWIDTLPDDPPEVKAKKAAEAVRLAELDLAAKRAYLPSLEARLAADQAKFAVPLDQKKADQLGEAAQKAEQIANRLQAQEDLVRAQIELEAAEGSDDRGAKKRVSEARKRAEEVAQALGRALETYTPVAAPAPKTSTGRRTALAMWIASNQNPLTARVAVNHLWMRHFGKPLVPTVVNFGRNGKPPSHPELLDWLAVRFMQDNWSMKRVHRLMVTSATYQMRSSSGDANNPNAKMDPENRYLWRMNPRRLEAETVRDSLLYLAGQLDESGGGPDIDEQQAETLHRRSLYFRHTPDSQAMFLKLFDQPDATDCYQRNESIVPQQALAVANSNLSFSMARLLARRIDGQSGGKKTDTEFIRTAFETILGEPPDAAEAAVSEEYLRHEIALLHEGTLRDGKKLTTFAGARPATIAPSPEPDARARENLAHALLNHSEFVTLR